MASRYGWQHQQLRRQLLREAIGQPCHFCGQPMLAGQALDLDHTTDAIAYRGMTHAACNRRDGALRQNLRTPDPGPSRAW